MFNPYDKCIANITIYGKQCTIAWYVDGNKVSHIDKYASTSIIEAITERFGELTVSIWGKHKYLGIDLDFLRKWDIIAVHEELHRVIHRVIQRSAGCKGIITR